MPRGSRVLRLFLALLVGALLLIGGVVGAFAFGDLVLQRIGAGSALLLIVLIAVAWAGIMTIVAARVAASDPSSVLALAERGRGDGEATPSATAHGRLAELLEERNRQIAQLAVRVRSASIADEPRVVAHRIVSTIRAVSGDHTWSLVILEAGGEGLRTGAYGEQGAPIGPVEDVHRWASVAGEPGDEGQSARHVEGPWGAFLVVGVSASDELRALLLAPREGRRPPSAAELDLYSLIGQHAAATIEHALIFRQVRHQAEELHRLANIQRDFLRGVSHDLQTPLTSIRALAGELRSVIANEQAREDLAVIEQQADRLRRMVGQLLAMSRLEAGALQPRQEVFRPQPVIRRAWDALHAKQPFTLQVEEPPHLVVADPDRLEQVLWAVLDNAAKYTPPTEPIDVSVRSDGGGGVLSSVIVVSDSGPGMTQDDRLHAFDQFYRSEYARTTVPDGSGIGLYAARGLVEAMGGSMAIDTSPGSGARVYIRLPAEPADEGEAAS